MMEDRKLLETDSSQLIENSKNDSIMFMTKCKLIMLCACKSVTRNINLFIKKYTYSGNVFYWFYWFSCKGEQIYASSGLKDPKIIDLAFLEFIKLNVNFNIFNLRGLGDLAIFRLYQLSCKEETCIII